MLEQLLKSRPATFTSGTVEEVDAFRRRCRVTLQSGLATWVAYGEGQEPAKGDTVIVAREGRHFVVQRTAGAGPAVETLLEV